MANAVAVSTLVSQNTQQISNTLVAAGIRSTVGVGFEFENQLKLVGFVKIQKASQLSKKFWPRHEPP